MALSVSEEMTQRTGESLDADRRKPVLCTTPIDKRTLYCPKRVKLLLEEWYIQM